MANNRMYLRCKHCGEILFLGKTYSSGYYYDNYNKESLEIKLNNFYDKHNFCQNELCQNDIKYCDTPLGYDGHNDNIFEIAYEFENDIDKVLGGSDEKI